MKEFIKVMKSLSEPNRVKIIKLLQERDICVCELREALRMAQPTVSKHLKILEDAGLVKHKKDGLWVIYSLSDGKNSPYAATLLGNLKHWFSDKPEIKNIVKNIFVIRREDICKKT